MPDIYDFDIDIVVPNLTPPVKRLPKYLAWLKSLATPIQTAWINLFSDWKTGSSYSDFDIVATYQFGDRVRHTDNKIYEATYLETTTFSGVLPSNETFWTLVNPTFVGADERITYNSQIIILEHSINKWFRNELAADQIYLETNQIVNTVFQMGNNGRYSSVMSNVGGTTWMGNTPSYTTQYNFTVNVPASLFATLGTDATNRENAIREFVDKYNLAGIKYNVTTY